MAKSGKSESDVDPEDEGTKDVLQSENETNPQSEDASVCVVSKSIKTSTSISIVIQSLVKNLCGVYENNDKSAQNLYNRICEQLYDMMVIDESYNMNEFEGMRNQYQRAFHHLLSSAGSGKSVPFRPNWPNNDITNEWSHYFREFDEISYIAGGGFGQVFRVKHKLDGSEYAIKKIFIRSEGIKSVMNYLSEVKTFASLNHSNIVQYKAAWLELGAATSRNAIMDESSDDYETEEGDDFSETKAQSESYIYPDIIADIEDDYQKDNSSDFEVSFEKSRHYSYSNTVKKKRRSKRSSISEGGNAICTVEEIKRLQSKPHPKWATLYIQMSLCQSTLKQWLESRNLSEFDSKASAIVPVNQRRTNTIMEILRQLLKGLEYIHFKGIVHHDIKPSNIFMQLENGSLLVQLGDFGLACPLQSAQHSLAFGTKLYAAPEQLAGKCDPKSDMYSLGIVLLELLETFRTDMERVHTITELRKGFISPTLHNEQPFLAKIVNDLVVRYPSDRPCATTLLKRINEPVKSEHVKELYNKLAEKDEEIKMLKELLKSAGIALPK